MAAWLVPLLISLAVTTVSYLLTPKPKTPRPDAARDLEGPTAEAGRPIPKPFGAVTISGLNVLWTGEKQSNQYQVKV